MVLLNVDEEAVGDDDDEEDELDDEDVKLLTVGLITFDINEFLL